MAMKSIELHHPPNATKKSIELAKIMISPRQKNINKVHKRTTFDTKTKLTLLGFYSPFRTTQKYPQTLIKKMP